MTAANGNLPTVKGDSLATLAAIGVLAYVGETMGHELVGHGGVCVLSGGRVTALAPLWMRCSVETWAMVAAGPLFNVVAAGICGALLFGRTRWNAFSYFLWISCAFNLLVACGYLVVGGTRAFGDWGYIFGAVRPVWAWRIPVVVAGAAGYWFGLRVLAGLYARAAGDAGFARPLLLRRTVLPGCCAACVACGAEIVGGRVGPGPLAIALGCTLGVGASLMWIGDMAKGDLAGNAPHGRIGFSPAWVFAAVLVAAVFMFRVGPVIGFELR